VNAIKVIVKDNESNPVRDAIVRGQIYIADTKEIIELEDCNTNKKGECEYHWKPKEKGPFTIRLRELQQ
jgi:hypothetical protein